MTDTRDDAVAETPGRLVEDDLLRVIHRVAHREYLLPAPARTTLTTRSVRRRPAARSGATRSTRGTTARKVTWSR